MRANVSVPDTAVDLYLPRPSDRVRVVVAMSGGVDSSVTACLLKERGYDVVGITLKLRPDSAQSERCCGAAADACDAARVCHHIGVPHYVMDYSDAFEDAVVRDFTEAYARGQTPVPCVRCNERIKFSGFLDLVRQLDADVLATGHYCVLKPVDDQSGGEGMMAIYTPRDMTRDQTYFLFATTQDQIDFLRFPLGFLTKSQVREMAAAYGLSVADKKDSQDICFVSGHYADVLARYRPDIFEPGPIYHQDGTYLGQHRGLPFYTIGQRRGIRVPSPTGEPLYVMDINVADNALFVGPRESLIVWSLELESMNWLGPDLAGCVDGVELYARIRSGQQPSRVRLFPRSSGGCWVELLDGECGVAVGQACVFYDGPGSISRMLGGGWIAQVHRGVGPVVPRGG